MYLRISSTACARLSTYPSGFTAGWFSSSGLRHEKHFIQCENLRYRKQKFMICMLASPLELWGLHCNSLHWWLKVFPHFKFAPDHLCKYAPCSKTSLSAPLPVHPHNLSTCFLTAELILLKSWYRLNNTKFWISKVWRLTYLRNIFYILGDSLELQSGISVIISCTIFHGGDK